MAIAWLFPGQGSQEVGMGAAVAEASPAARKIYERADAALGEPLSELCFRGPLEALTMTRNTQPALVATSIAILAAIRESWPEFPEPALAMGHSLGEYSALVASGALSVEDAVRSVRARGDAMQAAVPPGEGGMAAVLGVDPDVVRAICAEASSVGSVGPANFNAPGQIVIAGAKAAVERASALVAEKKGKAIALNVSAPFHCSLMKPAAIALKGVLEKVEVSPMRFPVVANVDAEPNNAAERVKELLVRQVDSPVEWARSIEKAASMGVTTAIEIGSGKVLAGLVKRIDKRIRVINVSDPAGIASLRSSLAT